MYDLSFIRSFALVFALTSPAFAETNRIVDHIDPINIVESLTLTDVIDQTQKNYPDISWLTALEQEAEAIRQRSESWSAGALQAGLSYEQVTSGTLHIVNSSLEVPLWNWGQQDAEERLAQNAKLSAGKQASAIKLRIAGLVRQSLWRIALENVRYQQAQTDVDIYQQLIAKIKRRVDLGDLPKTDLLLAKSELFNKRSRLIEAEAELMHARKWYHSITRIDSIPAEFKENLSNLDGIEQSHPLLQAVNSQVQRKKAELEAVKSIGSGQNILALGVNSDRGNNDDRSNNTESFSIGISIPFGGSKHLAPQVAAVNVELSQLIAQRAQFTRDLELALHEARHNLEVNEVALATANQAKEVAEELLKMTQLRFSVGEISLMDLLKIQSSTQQAILHAKEHSVIFQRDKALYNQAVGMMP